MSIMHLSVTRLQIKTKSSYKSKKTYKYLRNILMFCFGKFKFVFCAVFKSAQLQA
jgi:hypothetical protein